MNWDLPSFEIGYWLRRSYQKFGLMTEAIHALTRYAIVDSSAFSRINISLIRNSMIKILSAQGLLYTCPCLLFPNAIKNAEF